MSDFDRELIDVITDVTSGQVWHLGDLVDDHGPAFVSRAIADGFGVVGNAPWKHHREALRAHSFIPEHEAIALVHEPDIPEEYWLHEAPGALRLEDEPNLIFSYAADDPEAIAEVRRRNAERRVVAERERRQLRKLRRRSG